MTETATEEVRGERMVESEAVVDEGTLKADREKREAEKNDDLVEGKVEDAADDEAGQEGEASEHTTKVGSGDGTEVVGAEEQDVEVGDDYKEITEEVTREVGMTEKRRRRFSKRLAGILASGRGLHVEEAEEEPANTEEDMESNQSDQENDEEDRVPLKGRLRSSKTTDQVATYAEGPEDSASTTHSSVNIPPTLEDDDIIPETLQETKESKAEEEAQYQQERKRKGKQPAELTRKKARKANPTITIQKPIQVPFEQPDNEDEEITEEEDTSSGELYAMSEERQKPCGCGFLVG